MRSFAVATLPETCKPASPQLASLPRAELERMAEAGSEIVEVYRVLAKTGDNVVSEILRGAGTFYEWDHYPQGDVYDAETFSQYYYHAHPMEQRFEGEHGHFHTFLRPGGMPEGIKPAPVARGGPPVDPDDRLSHLIAFAMTPQGLPFRLFTVNRWVTGETWYAGEDVIRMLDRFEIDHARPSWPTNRWITGMIRLFRPQIVELIRARDRAIEAWREQRNPPDVFEDRDLEITSMLDVSVTDQIRTVGAALARG
jgi:hypothetical protein